LFDFHEEREKKKKETGKNSHNSSTDYNEQQSLSGQS
jgi:hypothetical protein